MIFVTKYEGGRRFGGTSFDEKFFARNLGTQIVYGHFDAVVMERGLGGGDDAFVVAF